MLKHCFLILSLLFQTSLIAQNFEFDFASSGRRVCPVTTLADGIEGSITILFLDSASNSNEPLFVYRRPFGTEEWTLVAQDLPAGTGHWVDDEPIYGEVWEYKVKRQNTWTYQSEQYDATGYTISSLLSFNYDYKGQMVLLVADDIPQNLANKYHQLKKEITGDGWYVNELIVPRASNWDSGEEVVAIKNQISQVYQDQPENDKPKLLFILGHVPLPRCGSADVVAPDEHSQNRGARGCDAYYADMDGLFTDTSTYNPGGLVTPLAVNLPGDFKWDQDFFPSDIEMAFGRIDFADLIEIDTPELELIENYLDRLSNYRNVNDGFAMGGKCAFYFGYDNSNDGSFRSLPSISRVSDVYQNYNGGNHNQWVSENGPFKIYMQNQFTPSISEWEQFGMDATVYSSDQSYWGFGDVPQGNGGSYSRIRALLGIDTKCLITLWTTTGINIFHKACQGMALGLAMKDIMNHNAQNQYLEKPPQNYDDERWWNRTHFSFYGDPSLNLYQVVPPPSIDIRDTNGTAELFWERPTDVILGYQVYESDSELGKYERISDALVTDTTFTIPNYQYGHWYMVRAAKSFTSGCGHFIHMSMGVSKEGNLDVGIYEPNSKNSLKIIPNPSAGIFKVTSNEFIDNIEVYSADGRKMLSQSGFSAKSSNIDLSNLSNGIYFLKCSCSNQASETKRLVIQK